MRIHELNCWHYGVKMLSNDYGNPQVLSDCFSGPEIKDA